ncbi:MAG: hypothetical protein ACYTGL_15290 [Planctomycetota bacterium]
MQPAVLFVRSKALILLLSASALLPASGCGGSNTPAETPESNSSASESSGKPAKSSTKSKATANASESGPREIDGIPFDVFFDRPLEVAADSTTGASPGIAMTQPGAATDAAADTTDSAAASEAPAAAAVSWSTLISAEAINDEVRFLRNEMQSRLTNMGAYKRSTLEIPVFGSSIAFFAEIAARHDGDISWKENAKYIRVLGTRISDVSSSAQGQTRNSYDEVNDAFLTINEILNNNTPAELPEVEDESPDFADFAEMTYLMKRVERGQQWMQTNTGSESGFNDKAATAIRETAVLAAMSEAFKAEGYGYNEDEEFTGYLDILRDAGTGMKKAVEEKDFSKYDELRSQAGQQCTQCHSVYKNA